MRRTGLRAREAAARPMPRCFDSGSPRLNVGYLVRSDELPSRVQGQLMTRDTVRAHANLVRSIYADMMVVA
jgi:hypothetical protein